MWFTDQTAAEIRAGFLFRIGGWESEVKQKVHSERVICEVPKFSLKCWHRQKEESCFGL